MNPRNKRRFRLRLALAAAVLLPALSAAPAMAHDALESTVPAADTTVTTAPGVVSLTLSEPPMDASQLNLSVITVTDEAGKTLSDGKVTVEGATISTAITAGTNGPYKVLWRTVSSDGHPIEGTYTFTVQDPAQAVTATPSAAPTPTPTATESATPAAATNQSPPEAARPDDSNAPMAVGIAAAILAVAAVVFFIARKRRDKTPAQ
ncbi:MULTISPECIES: copper resistance CopC family protein [Paenarthrobacter]|uniref:Copper resistance protein CopC n=2 Tax=Paenarthrobacter TaxID=1742992 RepID=A0AAX3EPB3_PAEUR|nr:MULTISPECIES: copper resistance CopC family protein [Paenarthrobacter]NKR09915.1 copper resistance protein CopC [Arthrobacter sp. M5]NKR16730.1 copper resistance protein CopC [Arthrobacter sp. M6]MDO5866904.1 copper resistance protein CopC [Paenarthrobacter sp. SD-2]MDO5878052.1 copper resistance protein CopC [Paenarthrobacter sp. SD-1]UYV95412.1 copper resistance protein CopC [Paenarthrobacter ureafaciens]